MARCSETGSKKGKTQEQNRIVGRKNNFLINTNEGGIVKDKVGRNKKMKCAGKGR
jgi:hypothetical protein